MDYDLGSSTWRKKFYSPSTTLLAQKCYLCSRYVLSPMCPGRTLSNMAEEEGFEPPRPFRA